MSQDPEQPEPRRATPPKPVRDGLPDATQPSADSGGAQRGERKGRGDRGRRGRGRGGRGGQRGREDDRVRPTPVRESLGAGDDVDSGPPVRTFSAADQEWLAKAAGRAFAGPPPNRGAPLLHLTFHRPEDAATPLREILVVGTTLDDYGDEDLADLLGRARPYREPEKREHTRQRGRKRGL